MNTTPDLALADTQDSGDTATPSLDLQATDRQDPDDAKPATSKPSGSPADEPHDTSVEPVPQASALVTRPLKAITARWRTRAKKDSPNDSDAAAGTKRRRVKTAFRSTAALAFLALVAASSYEGWLLYEQHQKDVAATHALDAARKYAVTLTSTDPNALDANFTDILSGATGDFKDMYTRAGSQLRKMLIDNKVATTGEVVDAAIKSATTSKVETLLFVKQTVTNSTSTEPRTDLTAIIMTMDNVDGRWLASDVQLPATQG